MARPKGSKNAPVVDFDLSNLSVEVAELPASSRTRSEKPNPFTQWLQESWDTSKGRAVTVPNEAVDAVKNALRRAGNKLSYGVRMVDEDAGEGMTRIIFQAKHKREYKKKNDNGESSTPAE